MESWHMTEQALLELMVSRAELLERLNRELNELLNQSITLQLNQKQLQSTAQTLRTTLDEQLFWIPSNKPLDLAWLKQLPAQLERQFTASGKQLSVLEALLFNRELDKNAIPSRMPIANSYITSGFGGRADPFGGGGQNHKGIDFKARVGDPVLSVADGVVSFAGVKGGYGNVIDVDHGNGYVTRYAHNSRLSVRAGDLVRVGQEVAKAGSTGRSTGAHVHFEVWENGRVVNPRKFLGEGPTPVGQVKRG